MKAAGSIQIAALHLTEFAFGPTGHNYIIGHARNPWDPTRITGGSSAGTACAVAYGAITAGFGSDTGGSLRLPAAACGITSIKPTWGRVSRAGAMPLAASLDTLGFIARHVEDLALMTGIVAGHDPATSRRASPRARLSRRARAPVKGLRIGLDEKVTGEAHADVQKHGRRRARDFRQGRHGTRRVHVARLADPRSSGPARAAAGLLRRTQRLHATRPNDYGPQVRARLEIGHFISSTDHMTALRARGTYVQRALTETFKNIDVAILPILADPLPTIAELDVAGGPTLQQAMGRVVKFTRPINYLGLPTLTLPVPRQGKELPNGIQIIAKPYAEALLFQIGAAYQRAVPPEIARPL